MERFEAQSSTESIPIKQVERSKEKEMGRKESNVLQTPAELLKEKERMVGWIV